MEIRFHKYQGTGNDFILIDDRELQFPDDLTVIETLCHRRFGIGADGLILIRNHPDYDFEMVYYNSDGTQSMCGNGSRCAVHFAKSLGMTTSRTTFLSTDGPHKATINGNIVSVQLYDVDSIDELADGAFINTGSPHHIAFVDDVKNFPVVPKGKAIRYSEVYAPKGTNVNFVELEDSNAIFVRTYERGVEDETLSCGTGVTACSLAASLKGYKSPVIVHTLGGTLEVSFSVKEGGFSDIFLKGPATPVYSGLIDV
ncbi:MULTISPECIES: diaminopimelate epimerase [unclassified Imperialibacter]|uniref:diaminopimelate epimerase n=1 Tax=unclassified Imperialibacter TaxID=2629706 RepID=UPI001251BBDD|nr:MULTISPECIES: diaminopimelate epimerase [unclassified Imperialibacter]CAD5246623.1 Diaminopimelate epimerase [Imperialibacter sp. 75]CAD5246688.1 Diaminopimelate epimerase [Imperialibacter sp. 89]VVS96384.1 Diaminopimelate epimerase [Imperialibacter sp. EC-SDR9]